jgi:hypothetical protein
VHLSCTSPPWQVSQVREPSSSGRRSPMTAMGAQALLLGCMQAYRNQLLGCSCGGLNTQHSRQVLSLPATPAAQHQQPPPLQQQQQQQQQQQVVRMSRVSATCKRHMPLMQHQQNRHPWSPLCASWSRQHSAWGCQEPSLPAASGSTSSNNRSSRTSRYQP